MWFLSWSVLLRYSCLWLRFHYASAPRNRWQSCNRSVTTFESRVGVVIRYSGLTPFGSFRGCYHRWYGCRSSRFLLTYTANYGTHAVYLPFSYHSLGRRRFGYLGGYNRRYTRSSSHPTGPLCRSSGGFYRGWPSVSRLSCIRGWCPAFANRNRGAVTTFSLWRTVS